MKKITKEQVKDFFIDMGVLLAACLCGSYAVVNIWIPNGLTSGGLTGIVRIVQSFVDIDFSVLYYAGSILILLIVAIFMGRKEAGKIIVLAILYPSVMWVVERFEFPLLDEPDMVLAAVFFGVVNGICSGLVFWRGYMFSGTDAISRLIMRKCLPHVKVTNILLAIDAAIIIGSAFIFSRNVALYALISQVIFSKTMDVIILGFKTKVVQIEIVTEKIDEISEFVIDELKRGVSSVDLVGQYTNIMHKKLIVLCNPRQSILLKRFIAKTDKEAFVSVIRVDNVWGRGRDFDDIDKEI